VSELTTVACWKEIGVFGDSSCERLEEYGHCRNCEEYSLLARTLFDRAIPPGELEEWTQQLAGEKQVAVEETVSLLVFRVRTEWLALPTLCFQEALDLRPVHVVPFRTSKIFRGLVNVNGELLPCVSLGDLLRLSDETGAKSGETKVRPRMIVVTMGKNTERFVFAVDEVLGVRQVCPAKALKVPMSLSKCPTSMTQGVIQLEGKSVGWLDDEKFKASLQGSLIT